MAEPDHPAGMLDMIGRRITVLGTIVAAVVGMNSALATCSAESIARHQAFRQAVDGEEQYWRSLYSDYLGAFGKDVTGEEREARLLAVRVLAQRDVPTFEEYSLGYLDDKKEQNAARSRLESMKSRLVEALSRADSSTPEVAAKQQNQTFEAAVQTAVAPPAKSAAEAAPPPPPVVTPPPASAAVSYQTLTLAAGDPQGWDLDVFWCGGGDSSWESANYQRGLDAARTLAGFSNEKTRLGGEMLGRIRLVMLPEQRQGGDYPARGFGSEIRPDTTEVAMAEAVRKAVPGGATYKVSVNPPPPSRFYMSLFSCAVGSAPAGRPLPSR
jgi:hypothetical protein